MTQQPLWKSLRDDGIRRSRSHAEAFDPEWSRTAYALLEAYAVQMRDRTFQSEDFRSWCETRQFPILVPKALGAVFLKAARAGVITRVGFGVSRERHGSPCPLWQA